MMWTLQNKKGCEVPKQKSLTLNQLLEFFIRNFDLLFAFFETVSVSFLDALFGSRFVRKDLYMPHLVLLLKFVHMKAIIN